MRPLGVLLLTVLSCQPGVEDVSLSEAEEGATVGGRADLASEPVVVAGWEPANEWSAEGLRRRLVRYLWGADELPRAAPVAIEAGVDPPPLYVTSGQARVDRWTFAIGRHAIRGETMRVDVYYYRPVARTDRMVLLHNGHCEYSCPGYRETAQTFLDLGWAVAVVPMPGHDCSVHDGFLDLEAEDPSILRVFLEPAAFTLAHAETLGYRTFVMVGLSGGGWTTHVYSALDPRIRYSAPVAGSLPWAVGGDFEQSGRAFYDLAGYEDLYYLGAAGRRQTQILNEHDPCCFWAEGAHDRIADYARRVNHRLSGSGTGGFFRVVIDPTHREHRISLDAIEVMVTDLDELGLLEGAPEIVGPRR